MVVNGILFGVMTPVLVIRRLMFYQIFFVYPLQSRRKHRLGTKQVAHPVQYSLCILETEQTDREHFATLFCNKHIARCASDTKQMSVSMNVLGMCSISIYLQTVNVDLTRTCCISTCHETINVLLNILRKSLVDVTEQN